MILQTSNTSKVRANAIKNGWRSGLEESLAADLRSKGITYKFEPTTLKYNVPERVARYTPDFWVTTRTGKVIVIESKGQFFTKTRQLMLLVKAQHPDLDIRMVFSRSKQTISKTSSTSYAMWCQKHGFPFADKLVPQEWLDE
tara:strand:- start:89 stop:514 length:426 start_codon:yes stop_codon:yes gene_type:complete